MPELEKSSTSKVLSDLEKPSTSQGGKNQNDGENSNKSGIKKRKVTGIVLWFNNKKRYGFITRDDNKENVYVHGTAIIKPKRARKLGLYKGELVEFDIISKDNVFEASNVSGLKSLREDLPIMTPSTSVSTKLENILTSATTQTAKTKVTTEPAILDQKDEKIQKEVGENSTKSEMKKRKVTGIVKWFNMKKGFGFITRNDNNEDVYVHAVAIIADPFVLYEGQLVKFDVISRDNTSGHEHNEASNVSVLESLLPEITPSTSASVKMKNITASSTIVSIPLATSTVTTPATISSTSTRSKVIATKLATTPSKVFLKIAKTNISMATTTTTSSTSTVPSSTVWRSQEFSDYFRIKQTRNVSRSIESTAAASTSKVSKTAEDDTSEDPVKIKCFVESCQFKAEFSSMDQFKEHSIKQHFFDQLKNDLEEIDKECLSSLNCPLCQCSPPLVNLNSLIWHFGYKHEKVLKYTKSKGKIIEHKEINVSDHRNSAPSTILVTSPSTSSSAKTRAVTKSSTKATTSKTLVLTTGTITSTPPAKTTTTIIPITTSILTPSKTVASRLPTSSSVTSTSTTPTIATTEVVQVCLFVY